MNQLKIPFVLLLALVMCTLVWGGRQGQDQAIEGFGRGQQGGFGVGGYGGSQGLGRSSSGDRRYRSNLYSDDDVYGYDATYPNGEAAYINYRSKDARIRRGHEFERNSKAYNRQGGGGQTGSSYNQGQGQGQGQGQKKYQKQPQKPQISSGIW